MKDWRVEYKFAYLYSLINEKRIERRYYTMIAEPRLRTIVANEIARTHQDALTVINTLIKQVREGRRL